MTIIKQEHQVCTHELKSLTSFHFEPIKHEDSLDYISHAQSLVSTLYAIPDCRVLHSTGLCDGFYSDPWKSTQKVKSVVLITDSIVAIDYLPRHGDTLIKYHMINVKESVKEITEIAKQEGCAIDCDLYQILYGI